LSAADPAQELLNAAKKGQTETVRSLLKRKLPLESRDKEGKTLLMLAAEHGHADTVQFLLEKGADPTLRDREGYNAYALALLNGREQVLKLLPGPAVKRIAIESDLGTENLYSSCSANPQQLAAAVRAMRVDSMVAAAVREAAAEPGAAPFELVTDAPDFTIHLHVRPQVSCLQQESMDNLSLEIDVKVTPGSFQKTFGGGLKGLHARRAAGPAQYAPLFTEWAKAHGKPIYWAVVGALLK